MEIADLLKNHNIKPSHQRIEIYRYLLENRVHPSVETIYQSLIDNIPTLSRTTVYNTMKAFADAGIVSTLTIEENENRYDVDTSSHGHFKCEVCGSVYDFIVQDFDLDSSGLKGFTVQQQHLYLKGICRACRK